MGCPPDGRVPLVKSPRSTTSSPAALRRHSISPSPPRRGSLPAPPRIPSPTRPSPPPLPLTLKGRAPGSAEPLGPAVRRRLRPKAGAARSLDRESCTRRGFTEDGHSPKRIMRRKEPRSPPDRRPASEQSPSLYELPPPPPSPPLASWLPCVLRWRCRQAIARARRRGAPWDW